MESDGEDQGSANSDTDLEAVFFNDLEEYEVAE